MPLYSCLLCDFTTKLKANYVRHLNTIKHLRNENNREEIGGENIEYLDEHKMSTNEHKMSTNEHKMSTNEHRCNYCDKLCSSKAIMRRHELHYCKSHNNYGLEIKKLEQEKEKLYKQIEMLIEKAGDTTTNTTNNITNNIQINGFGHEDTSYITNKMLDKLVVYPGSMIPKLLALTHFHKDHPENKNLKITNLRSKYLKVFSKGKWILYEKDDIIDNIIYNKYDILEEHFDEKCKHKMPGYQQERFDNYRNSLDDENKTTVTNLKNGIELTIINNTNS